MSIIDVDVWIWALHPAPEDVRRLELLLSDDERKRAARFLSATDGVSYIVGRGRLREILGSNIQQAPERLVFDYGSAGKPALGGGLRAPQFNLSHSGGWAALAITARHSVGIDIEIARPLQEDIAGRFFSATEIAAIASLSPELRTAAFFRCWTRKEAFVKALGSGLNTPLASFDVSVADETLPALQRIAGTGGDEVACWRLVDFTPAQGVAGAIALKADHSGDQVAVHFRR